MRGRDGLTARQWQCKEDIDEQGHLTHREKQEIFDADTGKCEDVTA